MKENSYKYTAVSSEGKKIEGSWDKRTKSELVKYLNSIGYFLIDYKLIKSKERKNLKKFSEKDLYLFSQKLYFLIDSGISLIFALNILKDENKKRRFNLESILTELNQGSSLYLAMKREDVFPEFYINIIKSGELSGNLEYVLKNLADYYRAKYEIKKNIKSKIRYPITLIVITAVIMGFILENIIPSFTNIFVMGNGEMPKYTMHLIKLSNFFSLNKRLIKLTIIMIIILATCFLKGVIGKDKRDYFFRNSFFIRKYIMAHLSKMWGIMLKAGISLYDSIDISMESMNNKYLKQEISEILLSLELGNSLTCSLEDKVYFSELFVNLIKIGEETGKLDDSLNWIANYYEKDLYEDINLSLEILEPGLLIVVGLFIGFVMFCIIIPMFEIGEIF